MYVGAQMSKSVKQWKDEMSDYSRRFQAFPATGQGDKYDIRKIGSNGRKAYCIVADELNKSLWGES